MKRLSNKSVKTIFQRMLTFLFFFLGTSSVIAATLPLIKTPSFMTLSEIDGGVSLGGGLEVRTFYFESAKGNADIIKFYNKLWDGKLKSVDTLGWVVHSYFDGKYLYSIQVSKKKKGFFTGTFNTTGVIGISEPKTVTKERRVKRELFYPVSPGTEIISDIHATDFGKKSRTTVLDSPGSVLSNLKYYKSYYEQRGWREVLNKMSLGMARELGQTSLILQKGVDEFVLSFIADNGRTKIVGVLVKK